MQPTPYLLEAGEVDNRASLIAELQEDNANLRRELQDVRGELRQTLAANSRAIASLRRQLSPLYQALQRVFGEMESVAMDEPDGSAPLDSRKLRVWDSWKSKLPGKRAEFIQALLDHGEMTGSQLRVATHTAAGSVAGIIHELKKLGLINKNGGKYSLKEL